MLYLRPRSDPLVGKQLGDSGLRMCTDALENVARIKEGIDVESFARGDEAGAKRLSLSRFLSRSSRSTIIGQNSPWQQ